MKKKVMILRCVKLLCLVLCILMLSGFCLDLCRYYDYNVMRIIGFYAEPRNSLDVVFLGASDVFTGFSSAYAYDRYGFTSYPFVQDANSGLIYESQLREVRKHQNPKWIVVEINGFLSVGSLEEESGNIRRYLNSIPLSWNRLKTAWKTAPEQDRYFYMYPLAKDHGNWKSIPEQLPLVRDMYNIRFHGAKLKGNVSTINVYNGPDSRNVSEDTTTLPMAPQAEACLRSFLEYCRQENLENILFVRFPHVISSDGLYNRYCMVNEAARIVEEYGYDFLNMEREFQTIGLSAADDFYNEDHMNYRGQMKFTDYISRILVEEYGVTESSLTESQSRKWEEAVKYSRRLYDYAEEQMSKENHITLFEDSDMMQILENWK